MQNQAVVINNQFIVSGDRIEIRPLAKAGFCDCCQQENRFLTLLELERQYMKKVLAHVAGNKSRAATILGIDRVSLWRKLKKLETFTAITSGSCTLSKECCE